MATSRLEIDLSAVERNLAVVRGVTGGADLRGGSPDMQRGRVSVCAVLKQDAYGTGAARVGKRLAGCGVDMIGVYGLDEARVVAESVPGTPILVLMPVHGVDRMDPLYRHAASGRLHLTLHGPDQFVAVSEMAGRIGAPVPVHVQVDTGLSRGGCDPETARMLVEKVVASQKLRLGGLMTHFATPCCDDQFTREQARSFREFVESIKPAVKAAVESGGRAVSRVHDLALHAANSCATFRSRAYHGTMVRVGQSLLGYGIEDVPEGERFEFRGEMGQIDPAVRMTSTVVHMQDIPAGWPVGYGSTWRAPHRTDGRRTRIAVIPVGYADGYPRALGGRASGGPGWVGFTGRSWERRGGAEGDDAGRIDRAGVTTPTVYAPVVGRVSMDQITVDITDVPEAYLRPVKSGPETIGPEVEIYSRQRGARNFLPTMAHAAGTITHELLCRVGPRVERIYRYPAQAESRDHSSAGRLNAAGRTGGGIGGAAAVAQ